MGSYHVVVAVENKKVSPFLTLHLVCWCWVKTSVPETVKGQCRLFLLLWSYRIPSQHHRDSLGWGPCKSNLKNNWHECLITHTNIRCTVKNRFTYGPIQTLTIIQMWVYESQLVAGGGRIVFSSLRPAEGFLSLIYFRPSPGHWPGPLHKNPSLLHI